MTVMDSLWRFRANYGADGDVSVSDGERHGAMFWKVVSAFSLMSE